MFSLDELKNIPKSREIADKIIDMRDQGCSLEEVQRYIDGVEISTTKKE